MRSRPLLAFAVAFPTLLVASACRDSATAPAASASRVSASSSFDKDGSDSHSGSSDSKVYVVPLHRVTPLKYAAKVSAKIGALGGTLSIPDAGLTVVVPALALDSTVTISITARQGDVVTYDFEPHGIHFKAPLVVTQSLRLTGAQRNGAINPLALFAGYYPDPSHTTEVSELLNVSVDLSSQVAVFSVWHFSGYIFASGRCSHDDDN